MPLEVFPQLNAAVWDRKKTPRWSTQVRKSASGKEQRLALWSYPEWYMSLSYEVLTDDATLTSDLKQIMGFFNMMQGAFSDFLYEDISDNTVTSQQIGVGTGSATTFQMIRSMGGWTEPLKYLKAGTVKVYKNGVEQTSGWSLTADGKVVFSVAPAAGQVITADCGFYFRVRFLEDDLEFNQFMYKLYSLKNLEFVSLK